MKFLPLHTEALRYFGYTEEESRFLYLVATHSGYFTCQQFLRFIKTKPGKRSVAFARKIVEKKHASSKEYLRNGRVFHLFSRNLYEAISRENVRFWRVHSTEYIRTRLVALDFILRNQSFTFLESEEQKLAFFCDQMGIDKKILPHKRYSGAIKDQHTDRYFVDKFPMFYNSMFSLPRVMTFSFIDPGFESMDSFKTHLNAYLTLFTKLPKLRLYYVATRDTNFKRAEKIFQGVFHRLWDPDAPSGLLDYFRTRWKWDDKQYDKVSKHDMMFVNEAKERFCGDGIEDLYKKWRGEQITSNAVRSEGPLSFRSDRRHVGHKLGPATRTLRRTRSGKHKPRRSGTHHLCQAFIGRSEVGIQLKGVPVRSVLQKNRNCNGLGNCCMFRRLGYFRMPCRSLESRFAHLSFDRRLQAVEVSAQ
jgi:hypothetical protein